MTKSIASVIQFNGMAIIFELPVVTITYLSPTLVSTVYIICISLEGGICNLSCLNMMYVNRFHPNMMSIASI